MGAQRMELCFLVVLALATTMTVPVVGALLIFSLMIGPPAAARSFTNRPLAAIVLSVVLALATVWLAIASSYWTQLAGRVLRRRAERRLLRRRPGLGRLAPVPGRSTPGAGGRRGRAS